MSEAQDPTSSSSLKIKEKLAKKYVSRLENGKAHDPDSNDLERAYVAGFERARALCIDHAERSFDDRIQFSTLAEPYLKMSGGLKPSQVLARIGE